MTDLVGIIFAQRNWSQKTFGPGARVKGILNHIRKELDEVQADPTDLEEWIDIIILALDGAWRTGATPEQIVQTLVDKEAKNLKREWPDWRTASEDEPIEHIRTTDNA